MTKQATTKDIENLLNEDYKETMTNKIKFSELVKGDKIIHSHMGTRPAVSGIIKESPKQGRGVKKTILVDVKGSEVGHFDDIGSMSLASAHLNTLED